jgi:hypothetical protein
MERIEVLEGQLRKQGEPVEGQCRTCDADDLCGTEFAGAALAANGNRQQAGSCTSPIEKRG